MPPQLITGDRIRVTRTGASGRLATFTATLLENLGPHGYRIHQDDTGKRWLMAPTSLVEHYGGTQTITRINP